MQEACSIIQSAAHEDANIIFGAVLDEKMKDSVKITVIATGFKDSDIRRRQAEARSATFTVTRDDDFRRPEPDPDFDLPPLPRVMQEEHPTASAGLAPVQNEPAAVDVMRNAMIANFEQEDLDVPAFLRKRTEPM